MSIGKRTLHTDLQKQANGGNFVTVRKFANIDTTKRGKYMFIPGDFRTFLNIDIFVEILQ